MRIRSNGTLVAAALGLALVGLTAERPLAADREHQQIMADIRMLQEQAQQLQALMTSLGDALRAVNARLDDQSSLERKAFADGKVQMDAISGDIRIVREKVDETNVRLGSVLQELESLRQAMPEPGAVPVAVPPTRPPRRPPERRSADKLPSLRKHREAAPDPQRLYQVSYGTTPPAITLLR